MILGHVESLILAIYIYDLLRELLLSLKDSMMWPPLSA